MQSHIDVLIGRPTGSMTVIQKFPPVPLPTEEAKLRAMSNAQLKAYVMDWSQKLRNFDKSYRGEDDARFDSIPRFGENEAARNNYMRAYSEEGARRRDQQLSEYRTNFWGETVSIYKELVYRYRVAGKRVPDPMDLNPLTGTGVKVALNEGFLVAALGHPLLALAFYLETLAKDLPS